MNLPEILAEYSHRQESRAVSSPGVGLEPTTSAHKNRRSTTELHGPLYKDWVEVEWGIFPAVASLSKNVSPLDHKGEEKPNARFELAASRLKVEHSTN